MKKISLTQKQLNTYNIVTKANEGLISVNEAASALGLSTRQIKRLKKKIKEEGAAALVHKNTLIEPPNKTSKEMEEKILSLKKSDIYENCNFNHFRELLAEHHEIEISYSTLYELLTSNGIKSPETRRRFKVHRRRKRKLQAGLLLQVDATPFAWFKGDKKMYSLHGAIDDATGQITGLYLCKNECLQGYFEMLRRSIKNYGIPVSIYADRHSIFQSPNKAKAEIDSKVPINDTQFGRCLNELSVTLIAARSAQAKGRVERLWRTLQSRLPVEFALRDIATVDAANEFLKTYIYDFNSKFAVEPENAENAFQSLPKGINLDYILCIKEERVIDSGGIFSYGGCLFKVDESHPSAKLSAAIPPRAKIVVLASSSFGLKVEYRNVVFDVSPYVKPKHTDSKPAADKTLRTPKPVPDSNYYKYGQKLFPALSFAESDSEIREMLEDIFLKKL